MRVLPTALAASALAAAPLLAASALAAQDFATDDPVIIGMWNEGMTDENSQVESLAQVLLDSIGPRLTGSPALAAAQDWVTKTYAEWGIETELEEYGTWMGWTRGITHIDLVEPRIRTLNGMMLSWSPGTDGPLTAEVVAMPSGLSSRADFDTWVAGVEGKFVAYSLPEISCRAPESWEEYGTPESRERLAARREAERNAWIETIRAVGSQGAIYQAIQDAGAVGVLTGRWSNGWGANKVFSSPTDQIPGIHLSCEDYGLVHRLATNDQGPVIRLHAESSFTGEEIPQYNLIGTIPGTELPNEYVLLTAHLDSWDGGSGATDNGSGTIMMMEAMRLLRAHYPNPRRTIIVAHWGAEEQGLIGSGAWAHDHPEVVDNLQAAFNQDNGTWRIDFIRMQGFLGAGEHFGRWFSQIPAAITQHIELDIPGIPETGGSDHMSFICHQAAGFRLQSNYPDYRQYTWHTDIDTWDKLVFDDLRNNATLAAMLAYLASEDPVRMETRPRQLDGLTWPSCRPPRRSMSGN